MPDVQRPVDRQLSAGRGAGLAFAMAFALTLVMAAPVILTPGERIFGAGDILSHSDPSRDPLVVIGQFRTGQVPSPYLQPVTDLPGQVLTNILEPVVAYNIVVLLTFPLSALAAYLLARHVSLPHFGAMVAGLAYAFLPFHVLQAGGHPHIAQTQWLPLYLLALWRFVDCPGPGRAAWVLIAAALAALADFYTGFIIAVISPAAVLAVGWIGARRSGGPSWRNISLTLLGLIAVLGVGYAAVRSFLPDTTSLAMERLDLFTWSAKWWSYLIPPADHPLLGRAVREFWAARGVGADQLEHQQVSLGLALVTLALIPLWRFVRGERDDAAIRMAPALAMLSAAALVCSLSPERRVGSLDFVRPSALLYWLAPMFRAYARFGIVVGLMTALLAGGGVSWLRRSQAPGARQVAAFLLCLTAFEYLPFPPWRSRDILPTSAHRWLAAAPGPARVLDCVRPVRFTDTLAVPLFAHTVEWLGSRGVDDCVEPRLGERLQAQGDTHVIARTDTVIATDSGLTLEREFDDSRLFRVSPSPAVAYLASWSGFHPREHGPLRTWRWMSDIGTLRFFVPRSSTRIVLEVELRSFPGARRVEWFVDGKRLGEIEVTPEWRGYAMVLGSHEAGELSLTLTCHEAAVVARDVLGNGDPRALGIAVGALRIRTDK